MTTKLPDAVNAGDEIEVQLAPRGAYPQIVDGKEVVQIVDDAAVKSLIDNFNAEKAAAKERGENYQVLVDADHSSETGDTTKAMTWIRPCLRASPDFTGILTGSSELGRSAAWRTRAPSVSAEAAAVDWRSPPRRFRNLRRNSPSS